MTHLDFKMNDFFMKFISFIFAFVPVIAFSKTRLEDYYVGFEIASIVDHPGDMDGETFGLSTNFVPLESSNIQLDLTIGNFDDDNDLVDFGASYLYRFEDFDGVIPYVGVGLNHVDLDTVDDILWNLYLGWNFLLAINSLYYQGLDCIKDLMNLITILS